MAMSDLAIGMKDMPPLSWLLVGPGSLDGNGWDVPSVRHALKFTCSTKIIRCRSEVAFDKWAILGRSVSAQN
jgi:hypothetical protein